MQSIVNPVYSSLFTNISKYIRHKINTYKHQNPFLVQLSLSLKEKRCFGISRHCDLLWLQMPLQFNHRWPSNYMCSFLLLEHMALHTQKRIIMIVNNDAHDRKRRCRDIIQQKCMQSKRWINEFIITNAINKKEQHSWDQTLKLDFDYTKLWWC